MVSQCEPEDSPLRLLWPAATGSCSLWSWPCRTEEIGWRVPSNRLWCGPTTRTCPTSGTPSGCTPGRPSGHSFLDVSGSPSHTALVPETQSRMLSPVSSPQIPPLHSPVPPCIVGAAVWKVVEFLPGVPSVPPTCARLCSPRGTPTLVQVVILTLLCSIAAIYGYRSIYSLTQPVLVGV